MITIAGLVLVVAQVQVPRSGGFSFFEPVQPPRSLQVIVHRGSAGLAPENSARALEASIADALEWAEVDVCLTRDGHHILFHDETLDGKTDAIGRIRDRALEEVRKADIGSKFAPRFARERILTLEEALRLARGRINLYLDCKEIDPSRLAREVLAAGMGHQVVVYSSPDVLRAVREVTGGGVGLMTKWRPAFGVVDWVKETGVHAVEVDAADVTVAACEEFHSLGIKVQAKTLGDDDRPQVWDRVASAGVDWIQTDRPEEILARRALKVIGPVRVLVAHHRGAGRYAPENTLASLQKALVLGADFVEFDIRTTRDRVFVLLHDGTLDRTTSARGSVRQRTAAEVAALDSGSWFGLSFSGARIPTLDAFLDAATNSNVGLYVDAKDISPEALTEVLSRHGLIDRSVVYQGVAYLEKLKAVAPSLRRMPPLSDPSQLDAIVERVRPYAVDTRWSILSKPLIDRCHNLGIKVFSDAIGANESIGEYQKAIRNGIDLIQTDHPVRVLRAMELLGQTAPVVGTGQ
jgi:glycerophosphoryl diester phosphodiesterase